MADDFDQYVKEQGLKCWWSQSDINMMRAGWNAALAAQSKASGNSGELDEREAAEMAVLDHLGPAALTGGEMSVYEAFHLGRKARAAIAKAGGAA